MLRCECLLPMPIVTESAVEYGANKLETSKAAVSFCLSFDESPPNDDDEPEEEFFADNTGEKHVVGGDGGILRPSESKPLPPSPTELDSPKPRSNSCGLLFVESASDEVARFRTLKNFIRREGK